MKKIILISLLILLFTNCDLFKEDDKEDSTPIYSVTVFGRVVNSVTEKPIANATVSKEDYNYGSYSSSVNTDMEGYFSLVITGSGSYRLKITSIECDDFTTGYQSNYSENAFYNFKDINITPISYYTQLSGYVYDNSSNPVVGANVTAGTSMTTTDTDGHYSFSSIEHYGAIIILSNGRLENNAVSNNYMETITTKSSSYSHNITLTPFSLTL